MEEEFDTSSDGENPQPIITAADHHEYTEWQNIPREI